MKMRVSCNPAGPSGVRRWYVWKRTSGGPRKERLTSCLRRLERENNHIARAAVLAEAVKKGFKV